MRRFLALLATIALAALPACSSSSAPSRPRHVSAAAWASFVYVHWDPPARSGDSPIASYRVVAKPGNAATVVAGDQGWAVVQELRTRSSYRFEVTAVNAHNRQGGASSSGIVTLGPPVIHVSENHFVDAKGHNVRLVGVNRSGTEYSCVIGGAQGAGIFSGPSDAASIAAMASWRINAVRVPLNEDCWLGINGVNPAYSGRSYRDAIVAYVERLNRAGLVAILDLHWNAPGTVLSEGQQVMADADHSPALWTSVATTFLADLGVMFDLYNEPKDISWECWRSGCVTPLGWRTAGMQSLIDVVRATGATQPIVASGLNYANDLSRWLSAGLTDPLHQLVAGLHMYNTGPPGYCNARPCWDATVAPVAARVPVVTTEMGEFDQGSTFVTGYLDWAEGQARIGRDVSYVAWSWDVALGVGGPSLVSSYDGVPTAFGSGVRTYFQGLWQRGETQEG
jgi:endoglucanase